MAELGEQLENLTRLKVKLEKDKQSMKAEIEDLNVTMEATQRAKVQTHLKIKPNNKTSYNNINSSSLLGVYMHR